jgi:galactonate dehydratase
LSWKKELVTRPPTIKNGHIEVPTAPGWGADIDEAVLLAHPFERSQRHVGY